MEDICTLYRDAPRLAEQGERVLRTDEMTGRVAPQEVPERRGQSRRLLARLSAPVVALVVLTLGLGTYLHGQSPIPVSAQTVLHRAAAASPGPNEAAHASYRISANGNVTGAGEAWVGYDGTGTPNQFALTGADPQSAPRSMMMGLVGGTKLAQGMSSEATNDTVKHETFDGVAVYSLQSTDGGGPTFYYNAQSYVLQGADWREGGTFWQIRLMSYATMPLSAVPTGTFGKGMNAGSPGQCPVTTQKPCQTLPIQKP